MLTTQDHVKAVQLQITKSGGKRDKKLGTLENKLSAHLLRQTKAALREFKRQVRTGERSLTYWKGVES